MRLESIRGFLAAWPAGLVLSTRGSPRVLKKLSMIVCECADRRWMGCARTDGPCVGTGWEIVGIGLNYSDHAAESGQDESSAENRSCL